MTVKIFFRARKFRECLVKRREVKYGVVAEAARSTRHFENDAVRAIRDYSDDPPHVRDGKRANKIPLALITFLPGQRAKEFVDILRSRCVRPRIARRMHARQTSERGYNET